MFLDRKPSKTVECRREQTGRLDGSYPKSGAMLIDLDGLAQS